MKKYSFLFLISFFVTTSSYACDLCGCGNGGSFFGILPQAHKSFVGLRYGYKSYDSHIKTPNLQTHEDFWKTELWFRTYPIKRVQLLAFVPYLFNKQTILQTGNQLDLQGLGDMTLLANYNVFNTLTDTIPHRFDHNLLIGGGVKLPTGKYQYDALNDSEVANANFQLGTGSTDFLLNLVYTLRHKAWGLNYDVTYKINTQNKNDYHFGNRFTTNLSLLYFHHLSDNITLIPNAGVTYESAPKDTQNEVPNANTGGNALLASVGLEGYIHQFSAGINYQNPLAQDLVNGDLRANQRLNVHFTFLF